MIALLGIVVVFASVIGGFLLEKGNIHVLIQPAELVIIGGAALGTLVVANPPNVLKRIAAGLLTVFKGNRYTKPVFLSTLKMLYELFSHARKHGLDKLEQDVDEPEKSQVFNKYPEFLSNHHAVRFLCDTLRVGVAGGVDPRELEELMDLDLEVHHQEAALPVTSLTTVADSLPGLGIVAAVLGVVITMGALGGPPEEIGHKVAAALVGTFLGILLCYGVINPLANAIAKKNMVEAQYFHCLKVGILAFMRGAPPIMAVEFARRAIPTDLRPTFQEMENACKGKA